jgi:hypothetical protein
MKTVPALTQPNTVLTNAAISLGILSLMSLLPLNVMAQGQPVPINASGISIVDLPVSSADAVRLDIKQGRFAAQSVGHLMLDAQGIDFRNGTLKSLGAEMSQGNFDNVMVDMLKLNTNAFSFDTVELLNHQRFILDKPVNATVQLRISEDSLNTFVANPKTIEKLEKAVAKKTGNIRLIQFSNPSLKLSDKNRVKVLMGLTFGNAVAAPVEFDGRLVAEGGKVLFKGLQMKSNGVDLPVDISDIFEKKLNEMVDVTKLGKNNFTINADTATVAGKMLDVKGTAALTRLEFGK